MNLLRSTLALVALLPSLACAVPLGELGDEAEGTGGDDGTADDGSGGDGVVPPASERTPVLLLDDGAIDLLFIIDNSGSMGSEQGRANTAIAQLASNIAEIDGLDLRIGFSSTDLGNPWCIGTGAESGHLLLSSCRQRLLDFMFWGETEIDATEEACLDSCFHDVVSTVPTPIHLDDSSTPRPWIEAGPGGTNLDGVDLQGAVQCAAPMGIGGCGFESPLEAMYAAIQRSSSLSERNYGFLRPWARLAVVIVTDEADCSTDPAWDEIFLPEGNRVFWSDPESVSPSSALCWNAGVSCQGEAPNIGPCHPQNYDVDGNETDAASAVMRSLTRYIDSLRNVEGDKAAYRPDDAVSVSLIAGVPVGYLEGTAEVSYTRGLSEDTQFTNDFGVDPGCSSPAGLAVPPVRLRSLAELFPVGPQAAIDSICRDTYAPIMDVLRAANTASTETTACVPQCLADTDGATAGTQAQCEVILTRGAVTGREESLISACGDAGAAAGEACYRLRLDEQAAACGDGSNAELEVEFGAGVDTRGQVAVEVVCETDPGSC